MNYSNEFEINKFDFNHKGLKEIQSEYFIVENWPVVYILSHNGVKKAYVGETINTQGRMEAHLYSDKKNILEEALIISSKKFNKSATLDIESSLIKYLHADGKYTLLNGNLGLGNHSYYNRDEYNSLFFNKIWNSLIRNGIAKHTLEHISNSDLFKYSPYKTLSPDQKKNLMIIIDALLDESKKSVFIEGGAGTGKTILAIFVFKLILTPKESFNYKEFGDEELEFIRKIELLKEKYPEPKMALVIAMSSFRDTIKKVFRNIDGLNPDMVIGPSDLAKSAYDILLVDEAHRLRRRVNLTNYPSFDNTAKKLGFDKHKTNELEWTQARSEKCLYFYDPKQSIKPTDVNQDDFDKLKQKPDSRTVTLLSQFRSKGGSGYTEFVNHLLDQSFDPSAKKYSHEEFEVVLFNEFENFVNELKNKNEKHKLSRFVAGYGWEWASKKDKSNYDIEIEGIKFQWNHTNIDYINSDPNAEQVGCIHTTQGYDLNYVGVVFGPEIIFNPETGRIEVIKENYHDRNGKSTIKDIEELKQYIINIYKTIMLRGILGCYIYVYDENLRNYFKAHMFQFESEEEPEEIVLPEEEKLIKFENAVPLFSLKVAAGEFYFNESSPEEELVKVSGNIKLTEDHFAVKISGNSMNKVVKDGETALFKKYSGGSRNGLLIIAEHHDIQDVDFNSSYTFKEYYSQKIIDEEGWRHERIILKPKSYDPSYEEIIIEGDDIYDNSLNVVGVFVQVID